MSIFKKISFTLIDLILLILMALMTWENIDRLNLPWNLQIRPLTDFEHLATIIPYYMALIGLILVVLLLIALVVLLFWPRSLIEFAFADSLGQLAIKKTALSSFIERRLQELVLMKDPNVKVRLTRRKISVKIQGRLRTTQQVVSKTQTLQNILQQDLQDFFGLDKAQNPLKIKVKVADISSKSEKSGPRVT